MVLQIVTCTKKEREGKNVAHFFSFAAAAAEGALESFIDKKVAVPSTPASPSSYAAKDLQFFSSSFFLLFIREVNCYLRRCNVRNNRLIRELEIMAGVDGSSDLGDFFLIFFFLFLKFGLVAFSLLYEVRIFSRFP